jgi:hypothetical protein
MPGVLMSAKALETVLPPVGAFAARARGSLAPSPPVLGATA